MSERKRIDYLDFAKGIAIIFIRLLLSLTLGYGLSKISLIRKFFGQKTGAQLQKQ